MKLIIPNKWCNCKTPDGKHLTTGGHKITEGYEIYCPNCKCRYWLIRDTLHGKDRKLRK